MKNSIHGSKSLSNIFLFSGIVVFALFALSFAKFLLGQKNFNIKNTVSAETIGIPRQFGRILVILIDSLRKDMMFNKEYMPFMQSCLERGSYGTAKVLSSPITISCDKSIFAGQIDTRAWSLSEDFKGIHYAGDNLFKRLAEVKKNTVILSSDSIRQAFGAYNVTMAFEPRKSKFSEYREEGQYIFEKSQEFLRDKTWDFAVLQFVSVDFAGHLHTPRSPEYIDMVKEIDKYVEQLVSIARPEDTVLITAEHGMDDNGCHVDANEINLETPFIIFGPRINKVANARIFQIDWAQTLSILLGVNPFYDGLSLPAFEILDLNESKERLLSAFSKHFGYPGSVSYEDLDNHRRSMIGIDSSPMLGTFAFIVSCISVVLLCIAAFPNYFFGFCTLTWRQILLVTGSAVFLPAAVMMFGLWEIISNHLPFRADMIIGHPILSLGLLCAITAVPLSGMLIFKEKSIGFVEIALFILFMSFTSSIFVVDNPYYPLCWAVLAVSLAAFLSTVNIGWLIIFLSICAGFALRRLTYIVLCYPLIIPQRSTAICVLAGIFFAVLLAKVKFCRNDIPENFPLMALSILPCVLVKFLPLEAPISALMMFLCIIPLIYVFRQNRTELALALAFWMASYYVGTSSSIESLSLLVAFPIFIGIWIAGSGSIVSMGILVWIAIWILYVVPGNSFGYKVIEIIDPYIMGSVEVHNVLPSVCLIASRYLLPVVLAFVLLRLKNHDTSLLPVLSVAMLPVLWALEFKLSLIVFTGSTEYPWIHMERMTVLAVYLLMLFAGFLLAHMVFLLLQRCKILSIFYPGIF